MGLRTALVFYTCLPLARPTEALNFRGIAAWAPTVGLVLGVMLTAIAYLLPLRQPLQAAVVVLLWLKWTGGLHLDGAMDAADGLAVTDPARRLAVMADSRTGAFGAMAAIAIVGLKVAALQTVPVFPAAMVAAAWGRWGQLRAIWQYPYLKAEGKGKFHREGLSRWAVVGNALGLLLATTLLAPPWGWVWAIGAAAIAWGVGAYFQRSFGGQTGDTYGAIVEWTECGVLILGHALTTAYSYSQFN
ncbi:MAG: adenosylcobinamide-GDP ribazoletransferase [Oscillatoriales cyanobacterium SM2_1_8]|nr:adenosylcobinamide-GDP ribazoletransferase [Oscillatoriales cyanobacterium SM2_1_8]